MRVSREKFAANRERILEVAGALFQIRCPDLELLHQSLDLVIYFFKLEKTKMRKSFKNCNSHI